MKKIVLILTMLIVGSRTVSSQSVPGLQAMRQIEYTVDEGTWISLDVSPDGQSIVFELVGDLYTISIQGGIAKPIATGLAFQSQPRFSSDGKRITYISDESGADNIWIANADGSNGQNISKLNNRFMLSPEWSADNKTIFVTVVDGRGMSGTNKGEAELWGFDIATGEGSRIVANANGPAAMLISSPAPGPYGVHALPNGQTLYYTSLRPRAYGMRLGAVSFIMKHDLIINTGDRIRLGGTNPMKPLISPDAKWLAYGAENRGLAGLKCRELSTGNESWLIEKTQRSELEARASRDLLPNYDFTPDSKFIIAAFGGKIHKLNLATKEDTIIPFSAKISVQVPERLHFQKPMEEGPVQSRILEQLSISDDGRAAVSTFGRIYLIDLATGKTKRLTNSPSPREFMPAWSPDGKWIAFASWSAESGHLWKVSSKGDSSPVRISESSALWMDPSWSPDGTMILALRAPLGSMRSLPEIPAQQDIMRPPDTEIVKIPAQGGSYTVIARANNARYPHFTNKMDRVYLSAMEGLISVKPDGTDKKNHFQIPSASANPFIGGPRTYKISGDGANILALQYDKLYKVPAPAEENYKLDFAVKSSFELVSDWLPRTFAWSASGKHFGWIVGNTIFATSQKTNGIIKQTSVKIELPRESTMGTLVLRGAKAITMKGDEIIDKADIVITNNRITAIGNQGEVKFPVGVKILDLTGKVVVPGFIDVHAHWSTRPELWEPECTSAYSNLAFGITSIRDPQNTPDIFGYADWASTGEVPSPRIFSTGPSIGESHNIQSLEDARNLVRIYLDNYKTSYLKIYLPGTRQQRQWLIQACRELDMMPTTEAGGDAKEVITHFLDGSAGNEHTLSTQPMYQDLIQLFSKAGTTYTPTLLVAFGAALPIYRVLAEERPYDNPKIQYFFSEDVFLSSAKRILWFADEDMNYKEAANGSNELLKAGGRVALGGHGEMQGLSNHWEMKLMNDGGMLPHDILKVATLFGAETLGLEKELGSLEVSKLADLVILDKDPLENIRNTTTIKYVMKNGKLYDGGNLDEVWPEEKKLPEMWWHLKK